jgi:hypothetical protein
MIINPGMMLLSGDFIFLDITGTVPAKSLFPVCILSEKAMIQASVSTFVMVPENRSITFQPWNRNLNNCWVSTYPPF